MYQPFLRLSAVAVLVAILGACSSSRNIADNQVNAPISDGGEEDTGTSPGLDGGGGGGVTTPPAAQPWSGVKKPVEVVRDKYGIVHIFAATYPDAAYVVGYEQARDRMLQMDLNRRQAQGKLAAVFGEKRKQQDAQSINLGWEWAARQLLERAKKERPDLYLVLQAYSAGVTQYIDDAWGGKNGLSVPPGFRAGELNYRPDPWQPLDTLAIGKLITFGLSARLEIEIAVTLGSDLLPKKLAEDFLLFEPGEKEYAVQGIPQTSAWKSTVPGVNSNASDGPRRIIPVREIEAAFDAVQSFTRGMLLNPFHLGGSNNWVVSGAHTSNGSPMICNDPHLTYGNPPPWWMMHVKTTEDPVPVDTLGFSFPGSGLVLLGHTRGMAWAGTVVGGDVMDLRREKLSADKKRAIFSNGDEVLEERSYKIRIRKNPQGPYEDFTEEDFTYKVVPRHGPILDGERTSIPTGLLLDGADAVSIQWTGLSVEDGTPMSFFDLGFGNNCRDFYKSVSGFGAGAQNFLCADKEGNIGYFARALYPLRQKLDPDNPPWKVLPGDGYDWVGWFPNDKVPQAFNPTAGFVATANQDPWGTTEDNNPLNDELYLGALYDPGFREWRANTEIRRMIQEKKPVTPEFMMGLQNDTYSRIAARLVPLLIADFEAASTDPEIKAAQDNPQVQAAVRLLKSWDFRHEVGQVEPTIFSVWMAFMTNLTVRPHFSGLTQLYDQAASIEPSFPIKVILKAAENLPFPNKTNFWDLPNTPNKVETRQLQMVTTLIPALAWLETRFKSADISTWKWGEYHKAIFNNPGTATMNLDPIPAPGTIGTLNVAMWPLQGADKNKGEPPQDLRVGAGPSFRSLTYWENGKPKMKAIMPAGQVLDPASKYYKNFHQDWANGKHFDVPYEKEEVDANKDPSLSYTLQPFTK
ncbi:MAG: Penicillin acylase 2 proenzyme [Myxococcota bacterium]|nr:Penicillin acylase 2 proenzyme [Myxococcota bacterium]